MFLLVLEAILLFILIKFYIFLSLRFNIVDDENKIGNHTKKTPRGVGIICILLPVLLTVIKIKINQDILYFLLLSSVVTMVFFLEDLIGIDFKLRFILQAIFSVLIVYLLKNEIDQSLVELNDYSILKYSLVWLGMLWFVNLYNFMDGIDMMTGFNTLFFLVSVLIISYIFLLPELNILDKNIIFFIRFLTVAISVFLLFNKPAANVFIGDSGSVGLGFIIAYILIKFSTYIGIGNSYAICSYYILDSTISLFLRIYNKEAIYLPNPKAFFFQKAKRSGLSVYKIIGLITLSNITSLFMILLNIKYFNSFIFIFILSSVNSLAVIFYFKFRYIRFNR